MRGRAFCGGGGTCACAVIIALGMRASCAAFMYLRAFAPICRAVHVVANILHRRPPPPACLHIALSRIAPYLYWRRRVASTIFAAADMSHKRSRRGHRTPPTSPRDRTRTAARAFIRAALAEHVIIMAAPALLPCARATGFLRHGTFSHVAGRLAPCRSSTFPATYAAQQTSHHFCCSRRLAAADDARQQEYLGRHRRRSVCPRALPIEDLSSFRHGMLFSCHKLFSCDIFPTRRRAST